MGELLQRWAPLLSAIALAWGTSTFLLDEPVSLAVSQKAPPAIPGRYLEVHADQRPAPDLRDPFVVDQQAVDEALRLAEETLAPPPPEPEPVEELPPAFVLTLDSLVDLGPAGGLARINGQSLTVGQVVAGVDPEDPPVLEALDGSRAVLSHRGRQLVLDLAGQPTLAVRPPSAADAAAPALPRSP